MNGRRPGGGSLAGRRRAVPGGPRMARAALLSCAAALVACGGSSDTQPVDPVAALSINLTFEGRSGTPPGSSVSVTVGSDPARTVSVSGSGIEFASKASVRLLAVPGPGYAFSGWTLAGGLSCEGDAAAKASPCTLATGSVAAGASASVVAAFTLVATTLTVSAGSSGSVTVAVTGAGGEETRGAVATGGSGEFAFDVESTATLTAMAASGHALSGWTGACAGQGGACSLAGVAGSTGTVATFWLPRLPAPWRGPGSVTVPPDRAAHIAVPYVQGAFDEWVGAPCDGSKGLECDVSEVAPSEGLPVAVFRPFAAGGIKSLAFGLGYHSGEPNHFQVSFQGAMGGGFTPVPSLQNLDPDSGPARLSVSVHLFPWGLGAYLTEACDGLGGCVAARDGQRTLAQADSVAATGYFKAPNAGAGDSFGLVLALSSDGFTLAVGAPGDDSAATGVFAPGDEGYQAAPESGGAPDSGAVTVYRRSILTDTWALEAFVKAPVAGADDRFGSTVALSGDGTTLAVGARNEDSASTGVFAPGDEGYQAALDSSGAWRSGAAYIYRRLDTNGLWVLEAFVKAPVARFAVGFGSVLALSGDGSTLAVGAPGDNSSATGVFAPGDEGYQAALDDDSRVFVGAVTVYRRSKDSTWSVEAFVKAPAASAFDPGFAFGSALALSGDGATLAVGAPGAGSSATGVFAPGDEGYQAALESNGDRDQRYHPHYQSGAAYVHRRSASGRWALEAFVKAPVAGADDRFGSTVALSADGDTLAVGTRTEDSASTGTFAPGDEGYQAALDDNSLVGYILNNYDSGAVIVYRRSSGTGSWTIEAFVKAPNAGTKDRFGSALALSSDGAMLAVGAPFEDSAATGVFAPGDLGYQAALDDNNLVDYLYDDHYSSPRRGLLSIEKLNGLVGIGRNAKPNRRHDQPMQKTLAHSAGSGVPPLKISCGAGAGCDSGAVTIYRRPEGSTWSVEAFVKAPVAGAFDGFGFALALSGDGETLAVGAPGEKGGALPQPVAGGSAPASGTLDAAAASGAAYLY